MTEQFPTPLVPAEVDLRDFAFMPLDVTRLFNSRFHAVSNDAEWRAGVTLWCKSWQQVPCGSLPDDDIELCRLAELGRDLKAWRKVRENALHGWLKCSDGRLHHPVVTEKAAEAWLKKRKASEKGKLGNEKRWGKVRSGDESPPPEGGGNESQDRLGADRQGIAQGVAQRLAEESHRDRKGQGQGQGEGIREEKTSSSSSAGPTEQDGEGSEKAGRTPTIPCPYEAIVAAYHRELPGLPSVRLTSGPTWVKRQKAMRSLWGWVLSSRKSDGTPRAETAEQALAWVQGYFRRAGENDFVMGRTHRSAEHANWTADFDFLLTDKGMKQVIEKTATRSAA